MRRKGGQEASVGVTEGVNRQNDLLTAMSLSYWIWRLSHRLAVTPLFQEIEKDVGWSVDRFFPSFKESTDSHILSNHS